MAAISVINVLPYAQFAPCSVAGCEFSGLRCCWSFLEKPNVSKNLSFDSLLLESSIALTSHNKNIITAKQKGKLVQQL